jgi:glycosyltransferase involved in cell wall biosynthesis
MSFLCTPGSSRPQRSDKAPMPRHIVIDVRRLGDFGIGTYIRNLVQALARADKESRYTLVTFNKDPGELAELGPNFRTADYPRPDTDVIQNAAFPFFLRRLHPDLVHIPLNSVPYWLQRPYVVTIHDMSSLLYPARGDVRGAMHQERYRRGAARAERIIAVSHSTRRDIESFMHIPNERIRTIYSAPDPSFVDPPDTTQDQQILQRYSIQPPFILYAGTIRPQKNVPRLVEAFAVIRSELENHPLLGNLKLVIIGDELSRYPAVRRAVVATRVEPFVRFLGFVPMDTLKVFYRAATLFAFPSLHEGFGLAPLEAMACGTPVVASDIPALVEAVGDAAELVTPDNLFDVARGLRSVLLDENRRRELSQIGRARAQRFDWDDTARSVLDVYREITS